MAEKGSKKPMVSKKSKSKSGKVYQQEEDDDLEDTNGDIPVQEQQSQKEEQIPPPPEVFPRTLEPKKLPAIPKKGKFNSEPYAVGQKETSQTLPAGMLAEMKSKVNNSSEQQLKYNQVLEQIPNTDIPVAYSPLPPITTTQNLNEIFQIKLQSYSIKEFKVNQ
jgi:hypothetical protein